MTQTQAKTSALVRLAALDDVIEGAPLAVRIEGFPPLAVYRVGNEFFVTDNTCTHGNAFLSEGFQEGAVIECPFHGGAFDIATGAPAQLPCSIPLRTYQVIIADDYVCIATAA